jgi:hypothetical protein
MKKLFLLSEVAGVLRKKPWQVVYAITSGAVPEPKLRIGNKRIFVDGDIRRLATHFGIAYGGAVPALPAGKGAPCRNS